MKIAAALEATREVVDYHKNGLGQIVGDQIHRLRGAIDPNHRRRIGYLYKAPYGMSREDTERMFSATLYQHTFGQSHIAVRFFPGYIRRQLENQERQTNPGFKIGDKLLELSWDQTLGLAQSYAEYLHTSMQAQLDKREQRYGERVHWDWESDQGGSAPRLEVYSTGSVYVRARRRSRGSSRIHYPIR